MPAKRPPPASDRLDRLLGRRLARRRRELCLTLDEIEQRIGAAPGTVIQFEKGTRAVGTAELRALASTLGVSTAWFFTDPPCAIAAEAERFLAADVRIADPKPRRDILDLGKAAATE